MLNTSLELILKAAIDKSGLKLSPKLISKSEGEDTFPLIISFSSNDTVYTLHILSERGCKKTPHKKTDNSG